MKGYMIVDPQGNTVEVGGHLAMRDQSAVDALDLISRIADGYSVVWLPIEQCLLGETVNISVAKRDPQTQP